MSILVIGLGELGTAVIEALARHPGRNTTRIAVLLRPSAINSSDPAKQRSIEHVRSLGVSVQRGDIVQDSVNDLSHIFALYDTVVGCSGMGFPAGTQLKLARAVLAAGTRRYVPWQFGVDYDAIGEGSSQDLFDEQLEVRKLLRGQKSRAAATAAVMTSPSATATEWVIVSTGLFMSFLFVPAFGVVDLQARTLRALGSWETKVTVTTPDDIGTATAEVVLRPAGIANEVVYVAGDTVSYGQVAELVTARYGGDWKRELWDLDFLAKELEEDPDNSMLKYRAVFGAGRGVWWDMDKTLNAKRHIRLTGLEDYLKSM